MPKTRTYNWPKSYQEILARLRDISIPQDVGRDQVARAVLGILQQQANPSQSREHRKAIQFLYNRRNGKTNRKALVERALVLRRNLEEVVRPLVGCWEFREWKSQKINLEASVEFLGGLEKTLAHLKWIYDTFGKHKPADELAMVNKWRSSKTSQDANTLRMLTVLDVLLAIFDGPAAQLSPEGKVAAAHRTLMALKLKKPASMSRSLIFEICHAIAGVASPSTLTERELDGYRAETKAHIKADAERILDQRAA